MSKRNLQNKVKKIRFENNTGLSIDSTANEDTETLVKLQRFQSQHSIYNRNNDSQTQKDTQIVTLLKKLPKKILLRQGNKAKAPILRQKFGLVVNHKRIEHICRTYGLIAKTGEGSFLSLITSSASKTSSIYLRIFSIVNSMQQNRLKN